MHYADFSRYDDSARWVIFRARGLVSELGGSAIADQHVVLALLIEQSALVAQVHGLAIDDAQAMADRLRTRLCGAATVPVTSEVPFSASAVQLLEAAARLAADEGAVVLQPIHLTRAIEPIVVMWRT